MPQLNQIPRGGPPYQPGEAWLAAEAAGVDMSLLEHSLSLTVWERLVEHQRAFELVQILQNAKIKPQDSRPESLAEPANTYLPENEKPDTI